MTNHPETAQAKLHEGLALHQQGKLAEAERLYAEIAAQAPDHLEALHLLGLVALKTGRAERAVEIVSQAIALNPDFPVMHNTLACAFAALGRHQEALAACDTALMLNRNYPEAHLNRSHALVELKRFEEALAACDRTLALQPGHAEALISRSNTLNLLKRHAEALASADAAIALGSHYAEAHINRAHALIRLDRSREALSACDAAIALNPKHVEAYLNRSGALTRLFRPAEALADADRALALDPRNPNVLTNRGNALLYLGRDAEALSVFESVLALTPDSAGAVSNRAGALVSLKRHDEAFADYDRAIALKPDLPEAHVGRGMVLLSSGRFPEGFREYEFREKTPLTQAFHDRRLPLWLGEGDIAGKTLLILQELYSGDLLHFYRYAKLAEARGARVVFLALKPLHRLLKSLSPIIDFIAENTPLPFFDYYCPLMSLPLAFGTTLENIDAPVPYFRAEPDLVAKWKAKLGGHGFKIGICWQGSKLPYAEVQSRSCALKEFAGLSRLPGVRLISVQKNAGVEQLADLPPGMTVEVPGEFEPGDFDSGPDAFVDTAAIMEAVDLVISVDTSLCHLAGALGRPVWTALKEEAEWRWQRGRSDSPWYPTMRLFRQRRRNEWGSVFAEMEAELAAMLRVKTPDAVGA